MLSMPPELEVKVTPEMTVKQVRKIKQEARQKNIKMKPDVRGLMSDAYCAVCGNPLDDDTRPTKCPECGQMQDWEWYMRTYWPKEGDRPSVDTTDTVVDNSNPLSGCRPDRGIPFYVKFLPHATSSSSKPVLPCTARASNPGHLD